MIFLTVGTEQFPFDRLIQSVHNAVERKDIRDKVFAQTGSSRFKPWLFPHRDFIDYNEQVAYIKEAEIVVSHAGEGTLFLCLSLGKTPILFPRQSANGEHVDDHQVELARKMESRGKVLAAYSDEDLLERIRNYPALVAQLRNIPDDGGKEKLIEYLRSICRVKNEIPGTDLKDSDD